jgi:hypothetical protein
MEIRHGRKWYQTWAIAALILLLTSATQAADAPPGQETLKELELRRALISSQMQVMQLTFNQLGEELKKVEAELEKRKPKENK